MRLRTRRILGIIAPAALLSFLIADTCGATHRVEYRWESPHVTMVYEDVVGTPVPPSYGFQANIQDLGHKRRVFESFMGTRYGMRLGDKLDVHVSLYGLGEEPPAMEISALGRKASVKRPFTDPRAMHALLELGEGLETVRVDVMSAEQTAHAKQSLTRFPDDGFPVFSPSGDRIAFQSWRGDSLDMHVYDFARNRVIRLGGTRETRRPLTDVSGILGFPKWSPDEKMVAYVADGRLVVSELDRGLSRILTGEDRTITDFAWSPDGRRIAAVVSAPEDDIRYAQDVLLLDPVGATSGVSLRKPFPIFSRGYFPVVISWSPDSNTLAVVVNLTGVDLGTDGRYLSQEEMRTSILYMVDAGSHAVRSTDLPGHLTDGMWEASGRAWVGAITVGDQANVLYVSADSLATRTLAATNQPATIVRAEGDQVLFLDGEKAMIADRESRTAGPFSGAKVETVHLLPGIYGGYTGGSEDYTVGPEVGSKVVLVKLDETPATVGTVLDKTWGKVILVNRGVFADGWLSAFAKEKEIVYLDWSPKTLTLAASSSPGGGVIEMLLVKPGAEPTSLGMSIDRLPIRSLKAEETR